MNSGTFSPWAGQLPAKVTSFVGRRAEVRQTKQLFSLTRLVTLTGVGGVGKTRLATRVADDLVQAFRDGVCFVSLADLHDPVLLGHTVAEALGIRETSPQWRVETLTSHLAGRQMLIVLDNCEHLLEECARLASAILQSCPESRLLATSREPLGIAGESTMIVPPLSVPSSDCVRSAMTQYDAVQLFAERAACAVPGFEINDDNYRDVAALCAALDGLPLALELAAVRLRALSVAQIVDRLSDRYELLTCGSRSGPARQQTLRALISWSFELCTANEQALWMRMSVFSGGVEIDAAEGICSDERLPTSTIVPLIASLVDKSILIREQHHPNVRYRLLESIRQFGLERLDESGERNTWRRRHRDWYHQLVAGMPASWIGPDQAEQLNRLRRDHPNLRAALDFCLAGRNEASLGLAVATGLYHYWLIRGFIIEGRHWISEMLAATNADDPFRARALFACASLAAIRDETKEATALLDEATEVVEQAPDDLSRAYILQGRGLVALFQDNIPVAIDYFEDSVAIFERFDNVIEVGFTLFLCAVASALAGDSQRVARAHRRCEALLKPRGESYIWSSMVWTVGVSAWREGDVTRAKDLLRNSLQTKRPLDDQLGMAECLEAMAWVSASDRERERAATLLGAADRLWRCVGMSLSALPGWHRFHVECERTCKAMGERTFQAAYRRGQRMPTDGAIAFALEERARQNGCLDVTLTRRESEVATLIASGHTNQTIASRLVLSRRTVEAHVQHIMAKLSFTSRTQVAAWIAERNHQELRSD